MKGNVKTMNPYGVVILLQNTIDFVAHFPLGCATASASRPIIMFAVVSTWQE